eukprot:GHVQ01012579.1.p1 GENE.GHVQ01012579.1~~GHVQ01012579.1.p1  ORF type:complete len:205 (+),score=10.00 GHVQ01012579.1:21-635(+)
MFITCEMYYRLIVCFSSTFLLSLYLQFPQCSQDVQVSLGDSFRTRVAEYTDYSTAIGGVTLLHKEENSTQRCPPFALLNRHDSSNSAPGQVKQNSGICLRRVKKRSLITQIQLGVCALMSVLQCSHCGQLVSEPLTVVPCGHTICEGCLNLPQLCPVCELATDCCTKLFNNCPLQRVHHWTQQWKMSLNVIFQMHKGQCTNQSI